MNRSSICFDRRLIQRYDVNGPRYTSYPSAAEFAEGFTSSEYKDALSKSNERSHPLSLYVHVPFCQQLCYYCGCNKVVTRHTEKFDGYVDTVIAEAQLHREHLTDRPVHQVHFGGGTPSYLNDEQLDRLLGGLRATYRFDEEPEVSIEVDPRTVDGKRIGDLRHLGFNRLSLGIQDFDPDVQQAINRIQPFDDVAEVVGGARDAHFGSLSFDLIYGLPMQSVAGFDRTLDRVLMLRPDRIALYNYAHLPQRFRAQRLIRTEDIPSPETKLNLLERAISRLAAAGYVYIGMDHFALPKDSLTNALLEGSLQRNFQGYSTHAACDLVGLGVSAISNPHRAFAQNAREVIRYQAAINAGKLAVDRGIALTRDDEIRADAISRIMCQSTLDLNQLSAKWEIDAPAYFTSEWKDLQPLEADGLITVDGQRFEVSPRGRLLLRIIAMVFDHYRHSANRPAFSKVL